MDKTTMENKPTSKGNTMKQLADDVAARANRNGKKSDAQQAQQKAIDRINSMIHPLPQRVENPPVVFDMEPDDKITVKNRKGKTYSLPVKYFTHTGGLIPFDGKAALVTYCGLVGANSKAKKDAAKIEYVKIQNTHNTIVCIAFAQLGKQLQVSRMTSRRLVKTPDVKAVAVSGRTEAEIPAIEALADATDFGKARRMEILGK